MGLCIKMSGLAGTHPVLHVLSVLHVLLLLSPCAAVSTSGGLARLAPWLVEEPPALVQYVAGRGARVRCVARGDPPPHLAWLTAAGAPLHDYPPHRRVYSNGTLEVVPAGGEELTVRCRAHNAHGAAVSREVTLRAVSQTPEGAWRVSVRGADAVAGGVAALACVPAPAAGEVRWYRGSTPLTLDAPRPESRVVVAGPALLIRDVSPADAGPYSCAAAPSPAAPLAHSPPHTLTVQESSAGGAPRLVEAAEERAVGLGEPFCLPCAAAGDPPPHYTWYRARGGRLQAAGGGEESWVWARGAALCVAAAARAHDGVWLCKAYNALGDASAQHRVHVQEELAVRVEPLVQVVRAGGTARFVCTATDARAELSWLHDGAPTPAGGVTSPGELVIRGAARPHRGVYQCIARRGHDTAQAAAELRIGDSAPELVYTFIEQALRVGAVGGVSLRCATAGAPPPRLAWLLDGAPLDRYHAPHRYTVSEQATPAGDVVSALNITGVTSADGGRYTCRATNALGTAEHSARLNIYGPPSVRSPGPVRVVAGDNATIYCPYSGYPISSVSWRRRDVSAGAGVAVVGSAGRVAARGAALLLSPALPSDAGHYTCAVAAPHGPTASQDIEIQVRNPPKISPFMFSTDLTEGSSVQVLCGVSSGDKPMYFSWLKDGATLPNDLQIEEKSLNEFSLLMFSELSARHSGAYTCRVANHAATVNYTATLTVNVAPAWSSEPLDTAVLLGAPLLLQCAATGYPTPSLTWHKRIGERDGAGSEGDRWEALGERGSAWEAAGDLRARNGSLAAPAATRALQGLYRCTADNGIGPPLLKHVNVTVHEPPHFDSGGENVSSVVGRSAVLTCVALGDAPLSVHWTHGGRRVDLDSYRWSVSEARAVGGGLRSTLTLRAAERGDGGDYSCHARNRHGSAERALVLHVEEPPEMPRGLRLAGAGARWVRVAWRAPLERVLHHTALLTPLHAPSGVEPRHTSINLTVEADTNTDDGAGAGWVWSRVAPLRPAAAYSVRVAAGNHVGRSPFSEPLVFTTLEEAPAAAPQNVRVRAIGSGELHVSWSVPPQESWNGELLGYVVMWRELGSAGVRADAGGGGGRLTAPGWSSSEVALGGLRSGARYALTVRAYTVAGAGPPSPLFYATTADGIPEWPPTLVSCEPVSARSLRVRWSPLDSYVHPLLGYDVHYTPLDISPSAWVGVEGGGGSVRAGAGGDATLQGLAPATNYSVWVRARAAVGRGPPSAPAYCTTTEDVPGVVTAVRALAAGADALRITWLAPAPRLAAITHYMLYTRELGKNGAGGEWAQRVEAGEEEVWREVRGLRAAVYSVWVRASAAPGAGPPSPAVTAAPALPVGARVSSFGRAIVVAAGSRVRLPCAAVGAPPLHRRWSPLPAAHTLADAGDLLLHGVSAQHGGNYTCSVSNAGGSDAAVYSVTVVSAPRAPPAPRLLLAEPRALHLAWDAPADGGAPLTGYTVQWSRAEAAGGGEAARAVVPPEEPALLMSRLSCGARYSVTLRAHNAAGDSPPSPPLFARTAGDKAVPAPGKEFVWANSSTLRLNLLAWRARCPVVAWSVAVRAAAGGAWRDLPHDGESAAAAGLRPAAWYHVRVRASSAAGDTAALYRAPTRALSGERIGEAAEVSAEARRGAVDAAAEGGAGNGLLGGGWRAGAALSAGGAALLLAACAGVVVARRWTPCLRGESTTHRACVPPPPHQQLYSTEPGKRNGKTLTPPDGELEISPYATFSMSQGGTGRGGGAREGCALHLRTFGRSEGAELGALPPPRPNLLAPTPAACAEYGRGRSSDSESSGSPCAACAAHLYRAPLPTRPDTLGVESSAEDTSYSGGGTRAGAGTGGLPAAGDWKELERGKRAERRMSGRHGDGGGRRRREHAPTLRYSASSDRRQLAL